MVISLYDYPPQWLWEYLGSFVDQNMASPKPRSSVRILRKALSPSKSDSSHRAQDLLDFYFAAWKLISVAEVCSWVVSCMQPLRGHRLWISKHRSFSSNFSQVLLTRSRSESKNILLPAYMLQHIKRARILTCFWLWNKQIEYPSRIVCFQVSE